MQAALVCWFSRAAAAASETAAQGRPPNLPKPTGEGFCAHLPKGYVDFAMAFSFAVERINIRMRKRLSKPVHLRTEIPGA